MLVIWVYHTFESLSTRAKTAKESPKIRQNEQKYKTIHQHIAQKDGELEKCGNLNGAV
jgi:hypothetical protein